jgi:uncharacterized membrane protein YjjP (DUF1212 family)
MTPSTPSGESDAVTISDFLILLARTLHEVGQPSHLLEDTLTVISARLGRPVQAMAMPTSVLMGPAGGPVTLVARGPAGATDLARLGRCTAVADAVARGTLSPAMARDRLEAIGRKPPAWGGGATVAAYTLSATAFAVFFGGDVVDFLAAVALGLAVGLISVVLGRVRAPRLFELTAAVTAGFISGAIDWDEGDPTAWVSLAAGLIILLPGLSLVTAVEELANGHLASGSARLAGVAVGFLNLTFGVMIGQQLADYLPQAGPGVLIPLPGWLVVPALPVVAVGSMIRFRARPSDGAAILTASALALFGARVGAAAFGPQVGPFLAALLLSLAGQAYARLTHRPAEVMVVPGMAVLVPGSVGVRSLSALIAVDPVVGIQAGFQMFVIAMALVAGLVAGNILLRGRAVA